VQDPDERRKIKDGSSGIAALPRAELRRIDWICGNRPLPVISYGDAGIHSRLLPITLPAAI
jgi:hypothetical protein